ncbi:MAG: hypothetical protein DMF76_19430 [Acidobacteria bacterium]|nr:MAG: hypothetical protein DMF76_19430 [Acidobacteriota bacterium]
MKATPNSFERERRERLSQLAWCGEGCFDSRCLVNSDVGRVIIILIGESCMKHNFVIVFLVTASVFAFAGTKGKTIERSK